MSDLSKRLRELSPDKRKLLEQALQQDGGAFNAFPVSFAQQRLWFLEQWAPGGPAYHIPGELHMRGALDLAALRRGIQAIIQRHEILRTTFLAVAGQPVQIVHERLPIALPIIDLRGLPAHLRDDQAREISSRAARDPFDLQRGPLIRATLLRLGAAEHILLLTLHHIIADGWSLGVFWRELAALYGGASESALPDLAIQYADYARWQREQIQGERREALLGYWRRQLDAAPQILDLPTDRPRPPAPSGSGEQVRFTLDPALVDALAALGQRAGATLFMTMLAAWQALLARISGQDDLLVGTAVAGRAHPAAEPLIGCFVNTLALRASLADDPSFLTLLGRARDACLAAYAHQDLPFEQLVEALQPERDLGRAPLVQVFLTLQNAPLPPIALPGLALHASAGATGGAKFDLALDLTETAAGLNGVLEYDADLFDAATAERLARHFRRLLAGAARAPEMPVGALPLISRAERQQLIAEWNDTGSGGRGQNALIHELFAAQAARTPDAVAVAFNMSWLGGGLREDDALPQSPSQSSARGEAAQLTYAALDRRANQLAHTLRARGSGPEARVGVAMRRSPELIVALLGVLKAGSAYVPLDPAYPPERIRFMLEDSQARILVTNDERRTTNDEGINPAVVNGPSAFVNLASDWPVIAAQPATAPAVALDPANLAYLIYTSGSTGIPKGVAITHRSATAFLRWAHAAFGPQRLKGVLVATSICFDLSVFEIFAPLTCGGSAILVENALQLAELAGSEMVTLINTVPSAMTELLRLGPLPRAARTIALAGEPLPRALVQQLYQQPRVEQVFNLYGPSEDTTYSTVALMTRDDSAPPSIGRPIANTQVYLLDRRMQPVAIGVAGELYLGGSGLARGYLGRPELTAAAFVPNPFVKGSGVRDQGSDPDPRSPIPDPRLYRTGDLARFRPEGQIEFLGRIDGQVKLRGFRIELGEVEAALVAHPAVRDAAVVVRAGASGDARLVAYVVTSNEVEGTNSAVEDRRLKIEDSAFGAAAPLSSILAPLSSELRGWLQARLPAYMAPSAFVAMDALPRTPNGKLDRKALPAPDQAAESAAYTAPRTPAEERVARIWARALGLARVGVEDNFFALGGHSLLATQAIARLAEECQVDLPLRALFEHPTPASLAGRIEAALAAARRSQLPPLRPVPRDRALPLSFAQQRLWLLDQLGPGGVRYSIPILVRMVGALDVAALRGSLDRVVRRHEPLRTTFALVDGHPAQRIAPATRLFFPILDLRGEPAERRAQHAAQLAEAEARIPFDLARGPLLRVALLRLTGEEHALLLNVHHIVFDGWSTGVLMRELAEGYRALTTGDHARLPDLPIQYADFAVWQRAWLEGGEPGADSQAPLQELLAYWLRQLDGVAMLDLPTDRPRRATPSGSGAQIPVTLDPALSGALAALSRQAGATIFMTLLAGWQALLARYSGQDDILVGTPIAGRAHPAVEPLIGCFVNPLALRTSFADDPSFLTLIERVRSTCLAAYEHQDLPFERLVDALVPAHERGHAPLMQVFLTTQNAPMPPIGLPGLTLHPRGVATGSAKYDLLLDLTESAAGLAGWLEYDADLFDAATVERMIGHFRTLLEGIAADPARRLADLPLLTAAERDMLAGWNATQTPYPHDRCFHELIEAQAARSPDAVALVFDVTKDEGRRTKDEGRTPFAAQLTYAELDRRANQLAHYLRARGVGPEIRVGICMERSLEMIVALLGVLKAGSAYVPLDPAYPPERLAFMLEDSQAHTIVTRDEGRRTNAASPIFGLSSFVNLPSIDLGGDWEAIAREPDERPDSGVTPDNLAYMMYTSGSTGRPKGVLVAHRGICNSVAVEIDMLQTGPGDHVLQFFSLSFDASLYEMAMTLPAGATLHLAAQEMLLPGPACADLLRRQGITIYATAPSVLAAMPFEPFPALRTIIVLGEACPADLVARWGAGRRVFNAYGPTEATMWAVGTYIDGSRRVPIGRPIGNAQVYLLNQRLQLTPVGVTGELYIGGVGLARGYHQRPDLTAERFIPNPFAAVGNTQSPAGSFHLIADHRLPTADCRLYQTGDLARYRPDGEIEYLGRGDAQVKIHGYRIELGEIEAALARHPAVRKSVVLAREDAPGDRRLVAYIVPAGTTKDEGRRTKDEGYPAGAQTNDGGSAIGDTPLSSLVLRPSSLSGELRDFLKAQLPEYMIPAAFVPLDALPLSPTGKLDYRALPAPDWSNPTQDDDFVAPRTPIEEVTAGIWADVLGLARVGVYDNFFAIGGHSLRATQTIARLRAAFQIELPLHHLFENPTVADLAAVIAAARADDAGSSAPAIQPAPRDGNPPLSFAQQRMWFLDQMEPESPLYLLPGAIRLTGRIDVAALRRSLADVAARHESLRTTFAAVEGRPAQMIAPALDPPLPLIDLQALPARAEAAARLADRAARTPFDLARGPLIRVALLRIAPAEHILLLTLHHIIADGWSIGVFVRDLAALYQARVARTHPALPDLPIQYADYAAWQRAWLHGAEDASESPLQAQLAYWTRQLAGAPQALDLPTDRPRPAIAALQGRRLPLQIAPALMDALAALSRRADVTLFMALLAAWQTVLSRYSGQADLLVGAPIAGRTRAETEPLIGCFVNTLALRGDLSGDPSFRALLDRTRAVCLGAYAHQDLPFERLVEELQPARDLSRAPLVQAVFALQNAPAPPMRFPSFTAEPIEIDSGAVKFDLTLTLTPGEQGLAGSLGYATELFDQTTIGRMAGHFQNLLAAAAARPELPVADLPLLSAAEREQLLLGLNATATEYPPDERLHDLVAAQAARSPDAVALTITKDDGQRAKDECGAPPIHLSYGALDRRANQLAHTLRARGSGPEARVGICMERSIELIVAALGVLKSGAAYVPLDPSYPAERLRFMLEDSEAHALIIYDLQSAIGDLEESGATIVNLRADWDAIARRPAVPPRSCVTADNLAYVIYTSGSTGRPKGAMIPHRGIVNRLRWGQDAYGLTPADRVLHKAPFSFDASLWEIFWPLATGARLVLARPGGQQDSAYLVDLIARQQITIAHFVPSMLQFFLAEPDVETCRSLRRIFCGGEPLPGELAERCLALLPASLHNQYGPTETSVNATFWTCGREQPRRAAPIGRPIANMRAYVLDARMEPAPLGVTGELYLGGSGLGRGYLGRPDLTAAAFVPNPSVTGSGVRGPGPDTDPRSPIPDPRLYRTGDLARIRPDGAIEFVGRADQQVKLRGYRVELDEVAATLRAHPAVRDAVAIVREDAPGDRRLVAYIIPRQGSGASGQGSGAAAGEDLIPDPRSLIPGLRAFLGARLPEYMIPSAFVLLDALPLLPNGKLDRRALPAPDRDRPDTDTPFADPRTPAEALLARIWADVLGLERVGVDDNFFALGGHSLLATQAIVRMRDALGVALPLRSLFESPTVAALAARVAADQGAEAPIAPPIRPAARGGPLPLSFAQQRLWFLHQLDRGNPAYNMAAAVQLDGALDHAALARGLRAVVARHESLRTTFTAIDGRPAQVVAPAESARAPLTLVDLRGLPAHERDGAARRMAVAHTWRLFDLARGPLLRAALLRLDDERHVLLVTIYHIVADGWAIGVFIRELAALYQGFAAGQPADLPDLPVQYADYAIWQRAWLQGSALDAQLAYWKRQLAGLPALDLPADRPRPATPAFRGAQQLLLLDADLTAALNRLSRRADTTLFMTLLAAFQALLARYSGQTDIAVGSPIANRTRAELEGLIGVFVNILVLRGDLSSNPSFSALLARVREMTLAAYAHQDLPFELLVDEIQPARDLSRNPLFQVGFVLQNTPQPTLELPGLTLRPLEFDPGTAKFDLWFSLTEQSERLGGYLEYNTDLFEPPTIGRMLRHFRALLAAVVADPARRLADLPLLAAAERAQMLTEWNDTGIGVSGQQSAVSSQNALIHEQIAAQASRTPDAVALVFDPAKDQSSAAPFYLSYGALDARANQLAQHLRRMGAGLETCVGLCMERSPSLLIGLLGILKAGSAYLPLDPAYPSERIRFMLEDAGAHALVTNDEQAQSVVLRPSSFVALPAVDLRRDWEAIARERAEPPRSGATPDNLAYVIYTSGSTGTPKGVMVSHRNVANFFAAIDRRLAPTQPGVWLAITSVSFDISILELCWTLARGFRVVVQPELAGAPRPRAAARPLDFSLFYFSSDERSAGEDKYRLLMEGAKFADRAGFAAVWTPERHFHAFGGLYPNPSVISAALAATTERIQIRAGSVVLPLHHPVRVAEEWSVVDNLSRGRVGLSFAPGWHADDFIFAPERYPQRKQAMLDAIATVRALWRGEAISARGGADNELTVRLFPRPVQAELPIWLTSAGSPETFRTAGAIGANMLTHLLGQEIDELAEKIAIYRRAWREHGHGPGAGHVTLMLHAFVGDDLDAVRETVREPFREYLRSSLDLIGNLARSFGQDVSAADFSAADLETLLDRAFERYFATSGLMGTPETCMAMVERLKAIGVDELACLIDFGVAADTVLAHLPALNELRERSQPLATHIGAPRSLHEQIERQRVTHLQCTPSAARALLLDEQAGAAMRSLRALLVGGEALPTALAARLREITPAALFNMYGPTETTIWSAVQPLGRVAETVPIGRPIANTQVYVLDRRARPVPLGAAGELCIGGAGVARGYLGRPDMTADRFMPNPFVTGSGVRGQGSDPEPRSPIPDPRLYRTGDLARFRPDGALEFLGRIDGQVKIRGHRVELGEIEAALAQHPAVREAAVVARAGAAGDIRLIAYIVPRQGSEVRDQGSGGASGDNLIPDSRSLIPGLREWLSARLPAAMIPAAFVAIDALPRTPNGKLDRRALPPEPDQGGPAPEAVAPRTSVEQRLAAIWAEALGREQIGVDENFFELGGDSILSLQVIARATREGLQFTLNQLFQHPTIAGLALVVGAQPPPEAGQGPVTGPAPLSPIQRWFFEQDLPDPHHWNQALILEVRERPDPALLARAVGRLPAHHDALRMRFTHGESGWRQVGSAPGDDDPFTRVDLSALAEDEQAAAITARAAELQASLDLAAGPLMRVALFDLGPDRPGRLLLIIHHLVVDGISWRVLLEDLQTAYRQLGRGEEVALPPRTASFKAWSERLAEYARTADPRRERDYWLAAPRAAVPRLPTDDARPNTVATTDIVEVALDAEETRALLHEVPPVYRTQINDVLLTALAQAFARWTGSPALLLDLEGHGREDLFDDLDISRTVGWFTSLFPVLLRLEAAAPPGDAIKSIKEQLRQIPQRGIGYGVLRYLDGNEEIAQALRALPQAEIMFNYLGQFDQMLPAGSAFGMASESTGPIHSPRGQRRYLLEINGFVIGGRLRLAWTYSAARHRRATVERLARDTTEALRALIAHCRAPEAGGYTPSDFPEAGLLQEELDDILAEFNESTEEIV